MASTESPAKPMPGDISEAVNQLVQGKRHMLVQDYVSAVSSLEEACKLFAEAYGETANECGEPYLYYGKALLELSRMETGVLGHALQGVQSESDEDDEEGSNKDSKESDDQVENPDNVTGEERELIIQQVSDALLENACELEKKMTDLKSEKEKCVDSTAIDKSSGDAPEPMDDKEEKTDIEGPSVPVDHKTSKQENMDETTMDESDIPVKDLGLNQKNENKEPKVAVIEEVKSPESVTKDESKEVIIPKDKNENESESVKLEGKEPSKITKDSTPKSPEVPIIEVTIPVEDQEVKDPKPIPNESSKAEPKEVPTTQVNEKELNKDEKQVATTNEENKSEAASKDIDDLTPKLVPAADELKLGNSTNEMAKDIPDSTDEVKESPTDIDMESAAEIEKESAADVEKESAADVEKDSAADVEKESSTDNLGCYDAEKESSSAIPGSNHSKKESSSEIPESSDAEKESTTEIPESKKESTDVSESHDIVKDSSTDEPMEIDTTPQSKMQDLEKDENEEGDESESIDEKSQDEGIAEDTEAGPSTSTNDKEKEDDVTNLQLAWEVLELAKVIFERQGEKDDKLRMKLAEVLLKLGEVSIESENYTQAIEDLNSCLDIQKKHLTTDNRSVAETYYQLGLAFSLDNQFDNAVEHFTNAIRVLEERLANCRLAIEDYSAKSKDGNESLIDDPVETAKREIEELEALLPDIKTKIEDTEDMKKNAAEAMKEAALTRLQENSTTLSGATSSPQASPSKPTRDVSHLVKRKRKPEDEANDTNEEIKKSKTDVDGKTEQITTNGTTINGNDKMDVPLVNAS